MLDLYNDSDEFLSAYSNSDSFTSLPCLNDILTSQFSGVPKNFNVVHINAQSIPAHFPDMLASFDCTNLHAILISESWLKPCLPSVSYSLPGFQLIRNDRVSGAGGGVAIYLKSGIPFAVVDMSPQPPMSGGGEYLFLEVELHHTKILLGVYYCPSLRIDYFSSLETLLINLIPSYSHTIIMGDFNTCLLKKDHRSSSLYSLSNSCNLSILPLNATHHFPNSVPSLLDLIFVSSPHLVENHGQCSADAFSYHDLLYLSFKIRLPKIRCKVSMQRCFRNINSVKLREDAGNIDWGPLLASNSIDVKVDLFTDKIIKLYDVHAPIRPVKLKHSPSPWLTDEIKQVMSKKAAAKAKYKRRPIPRNWEKYAVIRNHCNKMCRDAQRRHIHNSVENTDPSKVWKFLRSMGVGKSRSNSIPNNLNIDLLNSHFSASPHFDQATKDKTINNLSSIPTPNCAQFFFSQVTDCDVKKSILAISSNAVGKDCISRNMLLPVLDEILPILSHILNFSLSNSVFPSLWKEAELIPLPKRTNPASFSEYRPISILPLLSKVFETLIHNQLSSFITRNSLLNSFQSGFRPGHSTTTALIQITDDIRAALENGKLTVLALLDFSNAFNTVDYDVLLSTLRSINISPTVIDWFRSYLRGRRQRIRFEDKVSSWCDTSAGVPQGGVLSPLLFALFINSITDQLISSYHLYADDLQIYYHVPVDRVAEAIAAINKDLARICKWSKAHGLQVNPTKTQVIVVGSSRMLFKANLNNIPQVIFDGTAIPYSSKVKDLGIFIDKNLSWGPQLQELSRKLIAAMGSLRRLRNFLPIPTKIALVQSILFPILDYADASYLDLTEAQIAKLERLQNFCIRFIFGLRKYDHVSEFRSKLKWLPMRLRRNTRILSLLYSILFLPSTPSYLKTRFNFLSNTHARSLRSTENLTLEIPKHNTSYLAKSFSVHAARLWNQLPLSVRQAKSLFVFKKRLKAYMYSSCV